MINKLNKILNILEKNHLDFYFNHSKEELEKYKNEAISKYKLNDDYDLCYIVNYIIKKMLNENDSHTKVKINSLDNDLLEINYRFINNKLYVYKISQNYEKYLYSEVLKINGVDINKIIGELKEVICSQTKGGEEYKIEESLNSMNFLRTLPSINNDANDFYITINNNGIEDEILLLHGNIFKPNYKYFIDNDIIHIIYSQCFEDYDGQMKELVNQLSQIDGINTYIVDLRGNTGGNSRVIKPLIEFLKDKKVIALIDKYIYSAGRWACFDLKSIGATFIGTDIGTSMNCFGNCPGEKYENFLVQASEKYFSFNDNSSFGITTKEKLDSLKRNTDIFKPLYFHPNIYVEESIDALKEGRDVYLEAAYEFIEKKKNSNYRNII